MAETEKVTESREPIGIAEVLPPIAASVLVRAAQKARQLPEGSFIRGVIVRDAIATVRKEHPELFRQEKP
ncbi:MAG: hypothetical protein IJ164_04305 [Duodenibacillus sp.]|nr:hypothetical protein [Duodenibacillus sp.]